MPDPALLICGILEILLSLGVFEVTIILPSTLKPEANFYLFLSFEVQNCGITGQNTQETVKNVTSTYTWQLGEHQSVFPALLHSLRMVQLHLNLVSNIIAFFFSDCLNFYCSFWPHFCLLNNNTYTDIHTMHMHTHIHTMHTETHTYTCTYTYTFTQMNTPTHTCTQAHKMSEIKVNRVWLPKFSGARGNQQPSRSVNG